MKYLWCFLFFLVACEEDQPLVIKAEEVQSEFPLELDEGINPYVDSVEFFTNNTYKLAAEEQTYDNYSLISLTLPTGKLTLPLEKFNAWSVDIPKSIYEKIQSARIVECKRVLGKSRTDHICDITKQVYDQYSFTKSEQVAIVKIQTPNCTKEKYFAVKNKVESSIPDNNLFLVLFVVLIATVVLVKKKD